MPEIDGLRFFAIIGVILLHSTSKFAGQSTWMGSMSIRYGWIGVPLFFCISGFILSSPFAEHHFRKSKKPSVKKYFLRRVTRLEPPFIISLLFYFFLLVRHNGVNAYYIKHLLASAIYMHNLIFHKFSLINRVTWSLEIEVQFYIIAPLLAGLFGIRNAILRRSVLALLISSGVIVAGVVPHTYQETHNSLLFFYEYFLCGFLMADIFLNKWNKSPSKSLWWDVIALASIAGAASLHDPIRVPLMVLVFFIWAFKGLLLNKVCTNRWIVVTGGMCYTLYLYHGAIMRLTSPSILSLVHLSVAPELVYILRTCVSVSITILVCGALFVALEKPFMQRDWPSKILPALQRAGQAWNKRAFRKDVDAS